MEAATIGSGPLVEKALRALSLLKESFFEPGSDSGGFGDQYPEREPLMTNILSCLSALRHTNLNHRLPPAAKDGLPDCAICFDPLLPVCTFVCEQCSKPLHVHCMLRVIDGEETAPCPLCRCSTTVADVVSTEHGFENQPKMVAALHPKDQEFWNEECRTGGFHGSISLYGGALREGYASNSVNDPGSGRDQNAGDESSGRRALYFWAVHMTFISLERELKQFDGRIGNPS